MKISLTIFICILSFTGFSQSKPKSAVSNPKTSINRGKVVYETYCLPCHQIDGRGVQGLNPPLTKTDWVMGDKKRLIKVILKGLDTPMEINGDSFSNVMASHDYLTDLEIADVLSYVRNSFGNKASIVTPADVKSVRASSK